MTYSLTTSYAGESLLSGFNWFNGADPSHGYVSYQNRDNAQSMGLYSIDENTGVVRLGVDHTNKYSLNEGRPSIRLESKQAFNHGLFIADFLHMPPSQCGLWPAFWSYGNDWPNGGEIDIIEGVNTGHNNIMSAHTANGCTQSPSLAGLYSGEQRNSDCAIGDMNIGCGFNPPASDTSSYGDGFNAVNGGVYAMKWDSEHISLWHFPRGSIPADIEAKKPNPDKWGLPQSIFGGSGCDVDTYWKNMNIVINTNFCGDYGDAVWGKTDTCTDFAPTCSEYVANNPQAFANAYWDVRYIDTYEFTNTSTTPTAEPTTTTTVTSVSTLTVTVGGTRVPVTVPVSIPVSFPANATTSVSSPSVSSPSVSSTSIPSTPTTIQPIATETPVNPAKIGNYAYLGCFDSSSDFSTFHKVAESKGMTPERCVELCSGETYAGVFNTKCFCADNIDADTRASATEGMCNRPCPGNDMQFCGGIIEHHENERNDTLGVAPGHAASDTSFSPKISRPSNSTTVTNDSTALSNNSTTLANNSSALTGNSTSLRRSRPFRLRRATLATPVTYALTVYGSVSEDKPEPPPAMAPGSNITSAISVPSPSTNSITIPTNVITTYTSGTTSTSAITSVSYVTLSPVPVQPPQAKYPTTLTTVVTDLDCDEDETLVTEVVVPVAATVTDCSECVPTNEAEVELPIMPTPLSEQALPPSGVLPPPPPPAETTVEFVENPEPLPSTVIVAAAPGRFDEAKRNAVLGLAALAMAVMML